MKYMNPAVHIYLDNLATAQVPQCMLTSYADCLTLGYHGSALTHPATYEWPPPVTFPCADPWDDPEAEYNPGNPLFSPWCPAPPDDPGTLPYLGGDFDSAEAWDFSASYQECYLFGNDHGVLAAISANLQSNDTIRMVTVETPSVAEDQTFEQALTNAYGGEQPIGHFGYWTAGQPQLSQEPSPDIERMSANWHFRDYVQQCPNLFPTEYCPTCPDAEDWANGDYGSGGTWIYWEQDPRTAADPPQSHPENDLRNNDVIYVPVNHDLPNTSGTGGFDHAVSELRDKWGFLIAGESGHISATRNEVSFQVRTVPPAVRGLWNIEFLVDQVLLGTLGGTTCNTTTMQTTHPTSWNFPDLLEPGGEYSDLAGAWFDVSTNWWDDGNRYDCGSTVFGSY